MNIELLRTFLELSRLKHFGRTAEALHITQAAVSARIKQLENLLDSTLFERLNRDIRLTPEGHMLVKYADRTINEWRKIRQEIVAGGKRQQLAIGGGLRLWDVALQPWFHAVRHAHPDLAFTVFSNTPEMMTRQLLDGYLDVMFTLEPAQIDTLHINEVTTLELKMVTTDNSQNTEQALASDYIMVDWGFGYMLTHRRLFPDAPEPHTRLSTAKMAIEYMQELGGTAYLPVSSIQHELDNGIFHIVADAPSISLPAYAVHPVRGNKISLIRELLAYFN